MALLAQLVGIVGIGLLIATFQANSRSMILKIQIVSCLAWSLYYLLMGAYTGAGMVFVGAVRTYVYERFRDHEWIFEVSIVVYALITLLTWKDWTSILPFMGILTASVAMWQKSPQQIRIISLTPTSFWLPYNYSSGSHMGMIGDVVTLSSVIFGILRYDVLPQMRRRNANREATEMAEGNLI